MHLRDLSIILIVARPRVHFVTGNRLMKPKLPAEFNDLCMRNMFDYVAQRRINIFVQYWF